MKAVGRLLGALVYSVLYSLLYLLARQAVASALCSWASPKVTLPKTEQLSVEELVAIPCESALFFPISHIPPTQVSILPHYFFFF